MFDRAEPVNGPDESGRRNCNSNGELRCLPGFLLFRAYPWHMEVSRLGVKLELQLLAYATATATKDPSHVCDLNDSSQARDQSCILMDPSWVR